MKVPANWSKHLEDATRTDSWRSLCAFLEEERVKHEVLPPPQHVFTALEVVPLEDVRVVLVGQDPYPTPGHAHGLCFSVMPGVKLPGSLLNMYKELRDDLGHDVATSGHLLCWAKQGVLMLNTVMTVRAGEANSHQKKGWEPFTDAILAKVNARERPAVFVLWGKAAQKKRELVDETRHRVVAGAHPSPLSQKLWFGSRPFSKINAALEELGEKPIDWRVT